MPTYAYRCANCGHAFEQYQSFAEDSLTVCPECGEPQLRKVFDSIGVTFNGSGFYRNDSRSDASKPAGAASTTGAKSETKKDSTPAAPAKPAATSTSGSANS